MTSAKPNPASRPNAVQLRVKESVLRESLGRAGAPWEGPVEVHASPERGWRMRASLHFSIGANGLELGLRQEGTRRVVDVLACLQLSERMNRAARAFRAALAETPALGPRLRGLDLLESPDGGALLASLETTLAPREAPPLVSLATRVPGLDGFGVATGPRLQWLYGTPFVEASVLGVVLRARTRSFFQANRFLLEPLARTVVDLVPAGDGRVVDLYAGVGLFALPLAARGEPHVLAVEWSSSAAEDARWAAHRNGLEGVRVVTGDVARALAEAGPGAEERIVLDPPRAGAGPEVVALVADRAPSSIVYVSCDPPTLGRDLAAFARHVAEDTVFFSGREVQRGRAAVVAAWKPLFDGPQAPFSWEPDQVAVLDSGQLALSTGPVRNPKGEAIARFNSIWQRQADGRWLVIFDKGSPADPPAKQP